MMFDIIDKFIRQICGSSFNYMWIKHSQTPSALLTYCSGSEYKCHMSIPAVASPALSIFSGVQVAKVHSVPGLAFLTLGGEKVRITIKSLQDAMVQLWPVIVFVLVGGFFSGVLIWLLERWSNEDQFPKPFCKGAYEGFWWSYVSMTTVGYGDRYPETLLGRLFSIAWILFGISFIALITSIISNAIFASAEGVKKEMRGMKIGCLSNMPHAETLILRNGGIPKCTYSLPDIERDLATGVTDGFVIDQYELEIITKTRLAKLKKSLWVLQGIYDFDKVFAAGFYNLWRRVRRKPNENIVITAPYLAINWRKCFDSYMSFNVAKQGLAEYELRIKHDAILDDSLTKADESSKNVGIFDTESQMFKDLMIYTGIIIGSVIFLGLTFDVATFCWNQRHKKSSNRGYNENNNSERDKLNAMSTEEKNINEAITNLLLSAQSKLKAVENDIRNEINEVTRTVRRELTSIRRHHGNQNQRNFKDFPAYINPAYVSNPCTGNPRPPYMQQQPPVHSSQRNGFLPPTYQKLDKLQY